MKPVDTGLHLRRGTERTKPIDVMTSRKQVCSLYSHYFISSKPELNQQFGKMAQVTKQSGPYNLNICTKTNVLMKFMVDFFPKTHSDSYTVLTSAKFPHQYDSLLTDVINLTNGGCDKILLTYFIQNLARTPPLHRTQELRRSQLFYPVLAAINVSG